MCFPDVRISTPPNESTLPILTLPGVEESSLTAIPDGFWVTEAECRRGVEYITVVDQNSQSLASKPSSASLRLSTSSTIPAATARKHEKDFEDGEIPRSILRLLHDFLDFFQRILVSDIYYLAMVRQRGLG